MSLIHHLTIGHIDPHAVTERREVVVTRPLDMESVRTIIDGLGGDLDDVELCDNYVVVPWLNWNETNTDAVRLAQVLTQEFGCLMADVNNGMMVVPSDLSIDQ